METGGSNSAMSASMRRSLSMCTPRTMSQRLRSSSRSLRGRADRSRMDIVLRESSSTVLVKVLEKSGSPLADADVFLVADPAGLPPKADGSWVHHRSFRRMGTTSSPGNIRFTGVPPGRFIVRAEADSASIEERTVVFSGQESTVVLQAL